MSLDVTWCHLVSLDVTWCHLMWLGFTWSHLMSLGVTWRHLTSLDVTWCHLMSLGVTWCHLVSLDVTCCHLMSLEVTWCHLMSLGVTLCHLTSHDVTWRHLVSLDVTWCHLVSLDVTWRHLTSLDVTWCHLMSLDVTWCHLMSLDVTWCHLVSLGVTWCHLVSLDVTWCHLISLDVTWCHLTSLDVTWRHLTSLDVTWCHLMSLGVTWCHLVSLDVTWCHLMWLGDTWCHLVSLGVTWGHLMSLGVTWCHLMSFDVTWCHLVSLGVTWHHLTSLGVTWCHLVSLDVTWRHLTSLDVTWCYLSVPYCLSRQHGSMVVASMVVAACGDLKCSVCFQDMVAFMMLLGVSDSREPLVLGVRDLLVLSVALLMTALGPWVLSPPYGPLHRVFFSFNSSAYNLPWLRVRHDWFLYHYLFARLCLVGLTKVSAKYRCGLCGAWQAVLVLCMACLIPDDVLWLWIPLVYRRSAWIRSTAIMMKGIRMSCFFLTGCYLLAFHTTKAMRAEGNERNEASKESRSQGFHVLLRYAKRLKTEAAAAGAWHEPSFAAVCGCGAGAFTVFLMLSVLTSQVPLGDCGGNVYQHGWKAIYVEGENVYTVSHAVSWHYMTHPSLFFTLSCTSERCCYWSCPSLRWRWWWPAGNYPIAGTSRRWDPLALGLMCYIHTTWWRPGLHGFRDLYFPASPLAASLCPLMRLLYFFGTCLSAFCSPAA